MRFLPLLCLSCGLAAARMPMLAVMPFDARGVDSNAVRLIEDAVADGLTRTGKVRLLERGQMSSILKEQGFQQSGACDGEQCAVQMGKLLGVEQSILGSVGLVGKTYVLNARLIDVGTGEVKLTSQRRMVGEIDKVLTDLVPQAVSDLTGTAPEQGPNAAKSDAGKEPGSKAWVWWTLGGVAVAGGAAAALLLAGKETAAPAAPASSGGDAANATVPFDYTWIPAGN